MRVALVHPDLGLGGAERLVIDVALALQSRSHRPTIYTAHRDASRCFSDVAPGRERVAVRVVRVPLPRALLARFHALLAALRCAAIALWVCTLGGGCDAAVVDIVSLPVLVFAAFGVPVLFYCHFPDKTLEMTLRKGEASRARRAYRTVVDGLEGLALRFATVLMCNSRFTRAVFCETYPGLPAPEVVYPCVHAPKEQEQEQEQEQEEERGEGMTFVSLNRFERKKNIGLAIQSYAAALQRLTASEKQAGLARRTKLVVAGGYDARLSENVEHFAELERLVVELGLQERVELLRNVSDATRRRLMWGALAVVYTPPGEHFGIVPLEAMALGTPVLAVDSGGPTETVVDGECGFLREPEKEAFAEVMVGLVRNPDRAVEMGVSGAARVRRMFSLHALADALEVMLGKCERGGARR